MTEIVTIKGVPVIEIYESLDGSYWFITKYLYKQDSVIGGKVYKNDQIIYGYAKLSACPEFAEFGNISQAELKSLGNWVWKVPKKNWIFCPEVELMDADEVMTRKSHGEIAPLASCSTEINLRAVLGCFMREQKEHKIAGYDFAAASKSKELKGGQAGMY